MDTGTTTAQMKEQKGLCPLSTILSETSSLQNPRGCRDHRRVGEVDDRSLLGQDGLAAAARLLGDLDELAVSGLLQVHVERALARMDRDGMKLIRELASAGGSCAAEGRSGLRLGAGEFGHGIEHRKNGKENRIRAPSALSLCSSHPGVLVRAKTV